LLDQLMTNAEHFRTRLVEHTASGQGLAKGTLARGSIGLRSAYDEP
jgi:hypothetical protein